MDAALDIRLDDLSGHATRELIAAHLNDMRDISPEDSCHALDVDALAAAEVTVWSAWDGEELAGVVALSMMDADNGELKSMRVAPSHLGTGVGRALLNHVLAVARDRRLVALWLETGSGAEFVPAIRLYESAGFTPCAPFGSYVEDPYSVYLCLRL